MGWEVGEDVAGELVGCAFQDLHGMEEFAFDVNWSDAWAELQRGEFGDCHVGDGLGVIFTLDSVLFPM